MLVDEEESDHHVLLELKKLGVQLAIDDFGTGYTSLSYLRRLPIDTIKIDRSFASGLSAVGADRAVVESIVSLAHTLGMDVTAEGIETEEQLQGAIDVGVDSAQGYYLAPPLTLEAVRPFLASRANNQVRSWQGIGRQSQWIAVATGGILESPTQFGARSPSSPPG